MSVVHWMDARFYPGFSDYWDTVLFRKWLDRQLDGAARILDFGAGRGTLRAMDLRGPRRLVAAVDVDRAVLANPSADERHVLSPDGQIPYPDESFDAVVAHNVLEHLAEPVCTFREIHRVLRPDGVLLAKTPNRRHYVPFLARITPHRFHVWFNRQRGREERDTFPTHYRCNTPAAIRSAARQASLAVEEIVLIEGRPEYLRMAAPLYALGIAYERLVNAVPLLRSLRGVLFTRLRKPGATA